MSDEQHTDEVVIPLGDVHIAEVPPADIQIRDLAKREIDIRLVPWGVQVETIHGPEEFQRGALSGTNPDGVFLMPPEHGAEIGLGQDGRPILTRRPAGRALSITEKDDAAYGTFRVSRSAAGQDLLDDAVDGIIRGASVEFREVPGGTVTEQRNGRRVRVHQRVQLTGVSTTYRPAYVDAGVVAVRSDHKEDAPVAEDKAPAAGATIEEEPKEEVRVRNVVDLSDFQIQFSDALKGAVEPLVDRLASVEERARSAFQIPGEAPQVPDVTFGEWTKTVFQLLTGDRLPEQHMRLVADLITTDNAGVVPEAFISEIRGVIDASRPFMETTRRLPTPSAGTSIRVPKITQRPTVAEQTSEKTELSSQKTIIGSDTFEMKTKGGVGDLSLQLLKRSDPSFLDLYVRLLAEAYAIETDDEAVHELIDAVGNVQSANALDPNNLALGGAFQASFDAIRRPPDTIWLSTEALVEFIDAKASTTNQPMYSNITTNMTAGNPIQGTVSGLRVVHVPALDTHGAYAIVGPSSGFAWAEDGTYTLQVDVPAKAGRDVALVGMVWFVPWYPDAFSLYNVAS